MAASEKQMNFIKSLFDQVKSASAELDGEKAQEVAEKLTPYKSTIANVMKDEDVDFKKASELISLLISVKDDIQPKSASIRWKKIGDKFLISGPSDLLIEGEEVEVTSQKGKKMVTVGRIYSTENGTTLAHPAKNKEVNVDPGFYWKNDEIIEAYHTKKGFLVARTIVDNKKGDYLGKAGLNGLGEKLTLEEMKEFGRETGRCIICSRELTQKHTIEQGMGDKCAAGLGGGY